jgi:hypothetical protein
MSCWHGHWHHGCYPYPPPYLPPYPAAYPPESCYPPPRWRPRRRTADTEELAEYLRGLEEEVARVRGELEEIRRSPDER